MAGLSFYVGVTANIISVLLFLSPAPTFWRIIKKRSTEDFESHPYICTFLACALWAYYGIMKKGEYLVATVSAFGAILQSIYITLFLIFAPTNYIRIKTGILVGILDVAILGAAIMVAQFALEGEARLTVIGIMGTALNILMYASPLLALKTVVTTKSVEYMPFYLSLFLFINSGVWAFYAVLVRDCILGVANGSGCLLGATQLVIYAICRFNRKWMNTSNGFEERTQRERLIPRSPHYSQENGSYNSI